ncbi:hypothetical protein [Clostridium brassicae]|uniref:Uncharacterized protein n=1 Tax=Clostridium brassicae TaxID=2999072 RepID=A0ABT4D7M1_9CLOT|nr:hypothetical protein [Clostridium brassicae]MCY6958300.1 hypothetical protein [Clostridium brassicae]
MKELEKQDKLNEISKLKKISKEELNKIDIIMINNNELANIKFWCERNIELIKGNINKMNIVFKEIIIKITNLDKDISSLGYYKFNNNNEVTEISANVYFKETIIPCISYFNLNIDFQKVLNIIYGKDFIDGNYIETFTNQWYYEEICKDSDKYNEYCIENLKDGLRECFSILIYSQLNQESIITQTRTHTKKIQSKKDKRKGKKPKVKLIKQNIIRLNTDHIPTPTEEEMKHYERHTFGWTVRGHWRTYQSGKKVWIKPQVRGDKDKVEGKIYEI